ncbi:MAG TPA: hypothetical protein VLA98_12420 [Solirubrobacteraceae bacterium]|nr:hypothetical protein [Solirubrobacteraceae bacterium]
MSPNDGRADARLHRTVPALPVADVDALCAELRAAGVLHEVSGAGMRETDFGTREFATLDLDGNLLTFFAWEPR